MFNKKLILLLVCMICLTAAVAAFFLFFSKKENTPTETKQTEQVKTVSQTAEPSKTNIKKQETKKENSNISEFLKYNLPLTSVNEISKLPNNIRTTVKKILDENINVYLVKYNPKTGETLILMQKDQTENKYSRHSLGIVKINKHGEIGYVKEGYDGEEGETANAVAQTDDVWEFDNTIEPARPVKHTAFDNNGKVEYTENWNYSESEPVKYEMKNSDGNSISIMKEQQNNESEYNVEHIFYDDNGNTKMSLMINYEGTDIKYFSFYDSKDPDNTIIIESEFSDGSKIGEKIYDKKLNEIAKVKAIYKDGEISEIEQEDVKETEK